MTRPAWLQSPLGLATLAVLLFVNLLLLVANENEIIQILAKLPPPIATLVAGIVGLGVVGWQTRRGFENLIKSQEHRAKLEEDARLHQATISDFQKEKEIERDRKMLAGALRAELVAGLSTIGGLQQLFTIQAAFYKRYPDQRGKVMIGSFPAPIYKASIDKLGLLGPSIAADVIMVFSKANIEFDPEKIPEVDGHILSSLYQNAADSQKEWLADIYHVCDRLKSIEFGSPDPGLLIQARQRREKSNGSVAG